MANLKEIRSRISSVSSTMKITSAMKMVSAAKLKKAQDRMTNIKPYSSGLSNTIQNLLPNVSKSDIKLKTHFSTNGKTLIIAIASNRGLCGGFNANIYKEAQKLGAKESTEVYAIGKKATESFQRSDYTLMESNAEVLDNSQFIESKKISDKIINKFLNGEWEKVILIYNKFKNAATQFVSTEQLLPIKISEEQTIQTQDYIFEPNKTSIINSLVPSKIHTHLFEAILNSIASEHGARMTAMHKATDNANELKQNLTLSYNRQRQAAITNEILEIVAGAEALKGA
ncbi:MAG: ATP synthase F1 subunit gamma [Flavobacteriales bacterium]|jgi:F-type H+-transporting ATPase subunit gamma|nr:ATP synthase F1 subunit gamma [Flavobacteriales bacterium]